MSVTEQDILPILKRRLANTEVCGVDISDEINRDGLAVTFLTVRYRSSGSAPQAQDIMDAVQDLLDRIGGDSYPVLRLIEDTDAPAIAAE